MLRNDSCGGGGEKGWARLFLGPRDAPPNAMQVTGRLPHRPRVPAPDTRPRTRFSSETPWPAAIKLAREPIPFRATSLTTPVLSLDSVSDSPCQVVTDPFAFFFLPSFFLPAPRSFIRPLLSDGWCWPRRHPILSCLFLVSLPRLAQPILGQNPRHARSLPTAPSAVRRHCRRRRRVALAAAAALSSYARSRYRLVIIFDNPVSLLDRFRAEPSSPPLHSTRPTASLPLWPSSRRSSDDLIARFNPTNTPVFVCFRTRGASTQLSLGCRPLLSFWILAQPSRLCAFAH